MSPPRPGILSRLRLELWRKSDATRDLRDEMELHIALRAEDMERAGMSRSDALLEARKLFAAGDSTIKELHRAAIDRNRHMRRRDRLEALWQDLRYAARRLVREPATTSFILYSLALGIGINATAFSVVDRVLLQGPQHVREPDRLVRFYSRVDLPPQGLRTTSWLPHTAFTALRSGMRTIEAAGAYRVDDTMVGSGADAEMRRVSVMSSEMFPLLGVRALIGRFYGPAEDADPVVVIAEQYWRVTLGGDPDVVGRTLSIEDEPHTVIGVAPAGFTGVDLQGVDAWVPISISRRNSQNMNIVARLRPGVSIEAAAADVSRLRPQVESTLPSWAGWLRGADYLAAPISYDVNARESLESVMARWLAVISAIILVISCANVSNLLLAQLARRRRELGVRVALGSGRGRVVRLLALEGALLSVGAGLIGLVVIVLAEPVVRGALFPTGAWTFTLLDFRIIAVVMGLTLLTALLIAVMPAIQAGGADVSDALRGGNREGQARSPLRSGLTVVQAMLSVILLVGAGLFVRSMQRVNSVDLGMEPDRVVTAKLRYARTPRLPNETVGDWFARSGAIERARHRALVAVARSMPGVASAAVSVTVPLDGGVSVTLWVPGRDSLPRLPGGGPYLAAVGTDYFPTMGTAIRQGRPFSDADREGSEPVTIVNESIARALWPGRSALGECIQIDSRTTPCARIVGVAADIHRTGLKEEASMQLYIPIGQEHGFSGSWLVIRPSRPTRASWPELREALMSADSDVRSVDVRRLSQGLDGEMRPFRLGLMAFGFSGALAVIVAGLGLYSIMAHAVAWRRHEIGVRLALGAQPRAIAALVVGRGAMLATFGIVAGLAIVLVAGQWLQPQLFETSAADPLVLTAVVALLEAVALLAGWLPARRAVAVSPTEAMRVD